MLLFDEYLRNKVETAASLLHEGKYDEARRTIDAAYFMLGKKQKRRA